MEINLYLDMDGFVADFDTAVEERGWITGKCSDNTGYKYDIKGHAWRLMNHEFYENLGQSVNPIEFFSRLRQYEIKNWNFLTASINFSGCYSGKFAWLSKFIKDARVITGPVRTADRLIICGRKHKKLIAHSRLDVLIDDNVRNIAEWNKAGGIGILFDTNNDSPWETMFAELKFVSETARKRYLCEGSEK